MSILCWHWVKLLNLFSRHIPQKTIMLRTNAQPWFNLSCRREFQISRSLQLWRQTWAQEDYQHFADSRWVATRVYHEAEKNYNNALETKLQQITQPHQWWTKLKSSSYESATSIPPLLSGDGKLLIDPKNKAQLLHDTFNQSSLVGKLQFSWDIILNLK